MAIIEVSGLRKAYGDFEAVRGVSFAVDEGEVLAVLGPNGAGKTTTVEILEGYRTRDAGDVTVLGVDPADGGSDFRERIGIVLQDTGVEPYLTVDEILRMHAGWYANPRAVGEVIELVGLGEKRTSRVKTLSGGQRRRLDVALGLIGDPELLFLDEPTTGFDPTARRQAWDVVANLATLGKTVLLTTHYMDEAQALADRVVVIAAGEIVAEGTPESLGGRADAEATVRFRLPVGTALADVPTTPDVTGATEDDGHALLTTLRPTSVVAALAGWAGERGDGELAELVVTRPSLEDVYLDLTGGDPPPEGDGTGDGSEAPS